MRLNLKSVEERVRPLGGRMRTLYAVVGRRTQANHATL